MLTKPYVNSRFDCICESYTFNTSSCPRLWKMMEVRTTLRQALQGVDHRAGQRGRLLNRVKCDACAREKGPSIVQYPEAVGACRGMNTLSPKNFNFPLSCHGGLQRMQDSVLARARNTRNMFSCSTCLPPGRCILTTRRCPDSTWHTPGQSL